jgi:hypothetical protein
MNVTESRKVRHVQNYSYYCKSSRARGGSKRHQITLGFLLDINALLLPQEAAGHLKCSFVKRFLSSHSVPSLAETFSSYRSRVRTYTGNPRPLSAGGGGNSSWSQYEKGRKTQRDTMVQNREEIRSQRVNWSCKGNIYTNCVKIQAKKRVLSECVGCLMYLLYWEREKNINCKGGRGKFGFWTSSGIYV